MQNSSNLSPKFEQLLALPYLKPLNDLIRGYEAGERNFRGINLQGFKVLRNLDLRDIDLSQSNLSSVDLTGANLSGAEDLPEVCPYSVDDTIDDAFLPD